MKIGKIELALIVGIVLMVLVIGVLVFKPFDSNPSPPVLPPDSNSDANQLAVVNLVTISNTACTQCFSVSGLGQSIESLGVEIASDSTVSFDSAEGIALISKYDLTRLPSVVVTANDAAFELISPYWSQLGSVVQGENIFLFSDPPPVFFDLNSNAIRGLVDVTLVVDSNCSECNSSLSKESLEAGGIAVQSFRLVEASSPQGQQVISTYGISVLPTPVFSSEIRAYDSLWEGLAAAGTIESDGNFVLREIPPLYLDLDQNRLVGRVELQVLDYPGCAECLDANQLADVWTSAFGVVVSKTDFVHYPSPAANQLIFDYNFSKLPSVILSGDWFAYPRLVASWSDLGIVSDDNKLVLTHPEVLGPSVSYFDLDQNKLVQVGPEPGGAVS